MRISSNQMYQKGLDGMLTQQMRLLKLQEQAASNKRVLTPSDDPIAAAQITLMKHRIDATNSYEKNRQTAQGALDQEETVITSAVGVMEKLKSLQVQAGNAALSGEDRKALAKEAQVLLDSLVAFANYKDINGSYLFSGNQTSVQPFSQDNTGQFIYNGDDTQRYQEVSSGIKIPISDTGSDLFMRVINGNGDFSVAQSGTNTGNASATSGSVTNRTTYVPDNYTIQIALNSQNQKVVMVTGTTSGNVLPPTGNVDDAPLYKEGASIAFNGLEVTVNGTPENGDTFSIAPAKNESIFSTVQRMINNLNMPYDTAKDKTAAITESNQLLTQLDSALTNLLNYQTGIGAKSNQLTVAGLINTDTVETSTEMLSQLEDLNETEAIVAIQSQIVALQTAQLTFSKIQNISILNYL